MLDGLFGSKFSNKCKHSIKCIRKRLDPITKKKQAVVRYLRRDVAELLSHGHDLIAFGRMEALIVEMNQSCCYDMIEQYCADILNQLPVLQKQRECPDEAKEAISTIVFAAARFSDLPELCDLRRVFTERFGGNMESFVTSEFVKRAQDKTFSDEKKLQLMQGIAEEFSVRFDPQDFRRRMSNPAQAKTEPPKKTVPSRNEESYLKMPRSHFDDAPREKIPVPNPVAIAHKREVQVQQKVAWDEARELRAKQQVVRDEQKESRAELDGSRAHPKESWARQRELWAEPKDVHAEPKDIHVVSSKPERTDLHHRDYRFQAEEMPKKYHHKEKTRHDREKEGTHSIDEEKPGLKSLSGKEQGSNGLLFDRSRMRENGSDNIRLESNIDKEVDNFDKPSKRKGMNMVPPYTKPKATRVGRHKEEEFNDSDPYAVERPQPTRPVKDERAANMVPPYVKPGFEPQTKPGDHYGTYHDERPRPVSVRSRVPKPPVADAKMEDDFDEANTNHTPRMRQKHGHRHEIASYDDDDDVYAKHRHREKRENGVNGDMHDARHHLRRHKSQVGSVYDENEEEEEDNAIDYGNLLHGTPRSHRKHKERRSSRYESERDDEERMMDKLLMHYSSKGLAGSEPVKERTREYVNGNEPVKERSRTRLPPPPLTTRPSIDWMHHGPERASSVPVDQDHEEATRLPARAMSLQPDLYSPNGGRRHPNLPDYDELQARLRALRNA